MLFPNRTNYRWDRDTTSRQNWKRRRIENSESLCLPGRPIFSSEHLRLNNLRYFSSLSGQRAPRPDDLLAILLPIVVDDLLLGLLSEVRMIPQVLEVLGKLAVHPYPTSGLTTVSVGKRLKSRSEVHNSRTP
jgi:hypothetical protein